MDNLPKIHVQNILHETQCWNNGVKTGLGRLFLRGLFCSLQSLLQNKLIGGQVFVVDMVPVLSLLNFITVWLYVIVSQ